MTALWRELRSVLMVGALSAGVVSAFPMASLDFKARMVPAESEASASFVSLTAEEEEQVLRAAKTAWQDDSSAMQRMRARLPLGDLPEEDAPPPLDLGASQRQTQVLMEPMPYPLPAYRPSSAAKAPVRLAPEPEPEPAPAFSRAELLDLN